jgi:predicted ATP-grasp superfamily ATP-dependent carboligase
LSIRTYFLGDAEKLDVKVGVIGFPGWGNVGGEILDKLVRVLDAKAIAHIISYYFPDVMIADDEGFSSLPSLNAYVTRAVRPELLLITSKLPVDILPSFAYHQLLEGVVRFAKTLGCKLLVSIEGVGGHEDRAFVIGSSKKLVEEFVMKTGLSPLRLSRLPGYSGILVSLSRLLKMDAVGIIQAMSNPTPNQDVNAELFRKLLTLLIS